MRKVVLGLVAAGLGAAAVSAPALAQQEQFLPALVYRTGPYAPNGVPFANGVADYWTLLNERDGGINGVKLVYEECETGYATDKGVEYLISGDIRHIVHRRRGKRYSTPTV